MSTREVGLGTVSYSGVSDEEMKLILKLKDEEIANYKTRSMCHVMLLMEGKGSAHSRWESEHPTL